MKEQVIQLINSGNVEAAEKLLDNAISKERYNSAYVLYQILLLIQSELHDTNKALQLSIQYCNQSEKIKLLRLYLESVNYGGITREFIDEYISQEVNENNTPFITQIAWDLEVSDFEMSHNLHRKVSAFHKSYIKSNIFLFKQAVLINDLDEINNLGRRIIYGVEKVYSLTEEFDMLDFDAFVKENI